VVESKELPSLDPKMILADEPIPLDTKTGQFISKLEEGNALP